MSHKPILIDTISLCNNNKICFENFSAQIHSNKRIVIMGVNGTGKSTLLKIIQGIIEPSLGQITIPKGIRFGYVPQTITDYPELSGGQRFNKALSQALSLDPDVLCLDEPTNHLDLNNKRSLLRMLRNYTGTLIIISHDLEVLGLDFDEIWHIENHKINIFKGTYAEYLREHETAQKAILHHREKSKKELRQLNKIVQREQKIAAQSRSANKKENDRTLLGAMKESGSHSIGKKAKRLSKAQNEISKQLVDTFVHKTINPKFNLDTQLLSSGKVIISIQEGSCGYTQPILTDIHVTIQFGERMAIIGNNGTGKSTFLKALLHDPSVQVTGQWKIPAKENIGHLDQHYSTLDATDTVFETISRLATNWTDHEIRKHLNDFLFSTQQEITNKIGNLSGGEKARLSLAQIAAKSPNLLLLDEITNNVDLDTRQHIVEVLKNYPGTMILVSHDPQFLQELSPDYYYETKNGKLILHQDV